MSVKIGSSFIAGTPSIDKIINEIPKETFIATYDSTTYSEISDAYNSGKICYVDWNGIPVALTKLGSAQAKFLSVLNKYAMISINVTSDNVWNNSTLYFSIMTQDANKVLITDESGSSITSPITSTELGHLSGISSNIQSQLNGKQASGSYANTSASNFNATGKSTIVDWGMPNYKAIVSKSPNTEYTADTNGYIYVYGFETSTIVIDGQSFGVGGRGYNYESRDTSIWPIQKGKKYRTPNLSSQTVYFIPCIGG